MTNSTSPPSLRNSVIAIVCLASIAAAYMFFYFLPRMKAVKVLLAELDTKQAFIVASYQSRPVAESVERELDATIDYNRRYASQLMKPEELPVLYGQVSQITKTREITTVRFEPKPPVAYDSFHKIAVDLGITGSFASIHEMLRDMEQLSSRIWVEDLRFHGPRQPGQPVECDMSLVVFIDNPEKTD